MTKRPFFIILAIILSSTATAFADSPELIRYVSFDGNFTEAMTGNDPAEIVGEPKLTDGISGQALELDGSSALIYDDYFDLNLDTFTLTAWVYPHEDAPSGNIVGKGADIYWLFLNHGEVKAGFYDDQFNEALSTTYLKKDRWYFLAVTYDGKILRLYVDHHLHWIVKIRSAPRRLKGPFIIGAEAQSPLRDFLNASIDEVRLYNGALDKSSIHLLYQRERPN